MNWMAQISRLISTTIVRLCKNAMDAVGSSFFFLGFLFINGGTPTCGANNSDLPIRVI
jgi:hypothetical protein